jgi:hypothetical protein
MRVFWRNLQSLHSENGLQRFLRRQIVLQNPPLLASPVLLDPLRIFYLADINRERQWILELTALFGKFMYWQKLQTLAIVQNTLDRENSTPNNLEGYSCCDNIILIDADFTNISWIGMWITIGVFLAVCLLSFGIELLEWRSQHNVSLFDRELREELKINACKWIRRLRFIRPKPRHDPPFDLAGLPNRPPALSDEHPDDPLPSV